MWEGGLEVRGLEGNFFFQGGSKEISLQGFEGKFPPSGLQENFLARVWGIFPCKGWREISFFVRGGGSEEIFFQHTWREISYITLDSYKFKNTQNTLQVICLGCPVSLAHDLATFNSANSSNHMKSAEGEQPGVTTHDLCFIHIHVGRKPPKLPPQFSPASTLNASFSATPSTQAVFNVWLSFRSWELLNSQNWLSSHTSGVNKTLAFDFLTTFQNTRHRTKRTWPIPKTWKEGNLQWETKLFLRTLLTKKDFRQREPPTEVDFKLYESVRKGTAEDKALHRISADSKPGRLANLTGFNLVWQQNPNDKTVSWNLFLKAISHDLSSWLCAKWF